MTKLANLARMTTATTGTGTITLGSAVSGYLSFAQAGIVDGDVVSYAIKDGNNSEIGTGTYTASGTTLTRSVTNSTNSNAAISLSGAAEVFITPRAQDLITTQETAYWKDQAALLDPAAYVYFKGASWSVTIPAGETWYAVNAWVTTLNGSTSWWFHRRLGIQDAIELHAGDVIAGAGNAASFLYVCRPALVIGNAEYSDPKALYFSRLSALRGLKTFTSSISAAAGGAVGGSQGTLTSNLPTDFDDAIVAHATNYNMAWVGLNDPMLQGGLNVTDEISDTHQWRATNRMFTPFVRAQFPQFNGYAASVDGNPSGTTTSLLGYGVLSYYKLPSNWRTTPNRPYRNSVLADSPVIYYQCDEGSGTTIHDTGSAGLNATLAASSVLGVFGATGDGGSAIRFTSASGRIEIPSSTRFDFGSGDFTLETWVFFATLPTPTASFTTWLVNAWSTGGISAPNQAFLLGVNNGKMGFIVGHTDGTTTQVLSSFSLATGVFYHVIAGRSGGNLFIRVVGKETRQTAAVSKALNPRSSQLVWIGTNNTGASGYFNNVDGAVEEFALYSSALTDTRADAHHAAALGWA